jgi:hypothetical protein
MMSGANRMASLLCYWSRRKREGLTSKAHAEQ